ncbi:hypothetical protein Pelo_2918 [Pelomyxa schiedti]|nr:hypothetical protein Pelo_2918 [Pelomyxa schiedti]
MRHTPEPTLSHTESTEPAIQSPPIKRCVVVKKVIPSEKKAQATPPSPPVLPTTPYVTIISKQREEQQQINDAANRLLSDYFKQSRTEKNSFSTPLTGNIYCPVPFITDYGIQKGQLSEEHGAITSSIGEFDPTPIHQLIATCRKEKNKFDNEWLSTECAIADSVRASEIEEVIQADEHLCTVQLNMEVLKDKVKRVVDRAVKTCQNPHSPLLTEPPPFKISILPSTRVAMSFETDKRQPQSARNIKKNPEKKPVAIRANRSHVKPPTVSRVWDHLLSQKEFMDAPKKPKVPLPQSLTSLSAFQRHYPTMRAISKSDNDTQTLPEQQDASTSTSLKQPTPPIPEERDLEQEQDNSRNSKSSRNTTANERVTPNFLSEVQQALDKSPASDSVTRIEPPVVFTLPKDTEKLKEEARREYLKIVDSRPNPRKQIPFVEGLSLFNVSAEPDQEAEKPPISTASELRSHVLDPHTKQAIGDEIRDALTQKNNLDDSTQTRSQTMEKSILPSPRDNTLRERERQLEDLNKQQQQLLEQQRLQLQLMEHQGQQMMQEKIQQQQQQQLQQQHDILQQTQQRQQQREQEQQQIQQQLHQQQQQLQQQQQELLQQQLKQQQQQLEEQQKLMKQQLQQQLEEQQRLLQHQLQQQNEHLKNQLPQAPVNQQPQVPLQFQTIPIPYPVPYPISQPQPPQPPPPPPPQTPQPPAPTPTPVQPPTQPAQAPLQPTPTSPTPHRVSTPPTPEEEKSHASIILPYDHTPPTSPMHPLPTVEMTIHSTLSLGTLSDGEIDGPNLESFMSDGEVIMLPRKGEIPQPSGIAELLHLKRPNSPGQLTVTTSIPETSQHSDGEISGTLTDQSHLCNEPTSEGENCPGTENITEPPTRPQPAPRTEDNSNTSTGNAQTSTGNENISAAAPKGVTTPTTAGTAGALVLSSRSQSVRSSAGSASVPVIDVDIDDHTQHTQSAESNTPNGTIMAPQPTNSNNIDIPDGEDDDYGDDKEEEGNVDIDKEEDKTHESSGVLLATTSTVATEGDKNSNNDVLASIERVLSSQPTDNTDRPDDEDDDKESKVTSNYELSKTTGKEKASSSGGASSLDSQQDALLQAEHLEHSDSSE